MLKKAWHDPVWSKVIAVGLLTVFGFLASYMLNWWPGICGFFSWSISIIGEKSQVTNFVLLILAGMSIHSMIIVIGNLLRIIFPVKSDKPTWRDYIEDDFEGLHWRWRYIGGSIDEVNVFCPYCDFQIVPKHETIGLTIKETRMQCESCGRFHQIYDGSYEVLENKIIRLAHQKIRNGSWANILGNDPK